MNLGVAVDIGTTTVALCLVDLNTGEMLCNLGRHNAQAPFGADVTSRILHCAQNGLDRLTALIREQIDEMIESAMENVSKGAAIGVSGSIRKVSIAANTVMQHIAVGISPVSMGTAPYTPLCYFGGELGYWNKNNRHVDARVYWAPCVSAYVGGDITAGLLAAEFDDIGDTALFIDIGTNGEIVLKHKGIYYCCATAAGPAFEGAEIRLGMSATNGAVDHIWQKGGEVFFSVIGGGRPRGLCGSGLLDWLAVLRSVGAVDESGRLVGSEGFLVCGDAQGNGEDRVYLPGADGKIYITAGDIRKLQLAKAAIAAGVRVLLHYAGIGEGDIKKLVLAGGFGTYLNPVSAAAIGLIPQSLLPVAGAYGNTAQSGAVLTLLSDDARSAIESIRDRCEYIELSSNAFFNDKFVEEMAM